MRRRPELRLELGCLGTVDPFRLELLEEPVGSGEFFLVDPDRREQRAPLDLAGLNLVGAGQALLGLSLRWMGRAGRELEPPVDAALGEVRMVVRRREARLLGALLRRHLARLPEPPAWMPELLAALEQIDVFLRWEER
ncbi:MAG: hypothetical protein ACYTEZ_12910 [Planctomycetota bacterium]|jgi:hypothetical protein